MKTYKCEFEGCETMSTIRSKIKKKIPNIMDFMYATTTHHN